MSPDTQPTEVRGDLAARLAAAAGAVADTDAEARIRREARDALVVEAVDDGMGLTAAARHAGISKTRVIGILADSQHAADDVA